jgi:hypothetical protein
LQFLISSAATIRHTPAVIVLAFAFFFVPVNNAEQLRPETAAAFDSYVQQREKAISQELQWGTFLLIDGLPASERDRNYVRLKQGEVITVRMTEPGGLEHAISIPHGLIHHWLGTVFIPSVTLAQTLTFLQDYDDQYRFYAPEVQRSKLLDRHGNDFKVFLRLKKSKIITVILDTEYAVEYVPLGADREVSYSRSTRIAELKNAGEPGESEKPVGDDSGFLWRLNSYWRFLQRDGGVYVQLEAISLTRDIPSGIGWLVDPFVTSIPKESLTFTLGRTRDALTMTRAK